MNNKAKKHGVGKNETKNKKIHSPLCIHSHARTVNKGFKIDSWLNIVRLRQGAMENKLETDVQSEPKSIMKTFISKQNEVSRGRGGAGGVDTPLEHQLIA